MRTRTLASRTGRTLPVEQRGRALPAPPEGAQEDSRDVEQPEPVHGAASFLLCVGVEVESARPDSNRRLTVLQTVALTSLATCAGLGVARAIRSRPQSYAAAAAGFPARAKWEKGLEPSTRVRQTRMLPVTNTPTKSSEGEAGRGSRTLIASLEDSHVSRYNTPATVEGRCRNRTRI